MSGESLPYCGAVRNSLVAGEAQASNTDEVNIGALKNNNSTFALGPHAFPASIVPATAINNTNNSNNTGNNASAAIAPETVIAQQLQSLLAALQPATTNAGANLPVDVLQQLGLQELREQQLNQFLVKNQMESQNIPTNVIQYQPQPQQQEQRHISFSPPQTSTRDSKEDSSDNEKDIRIFPCKARGMPPNHNAKTAHLKIRKSTRHKEGLMCSHPACRDRGVKFCYCIHCGVPVAKRNFKKRHDHGITTAKPKRKARAQSSPAKSRPNVIESKPYSSSGMASASAKPGMKAAPSYSYPAPTSTETPAFQGTHSNAMSSGVMVAKRVEELPTEVSAKDNSGIPRMVSRKDRRHQGRASAVSAVVDAKDGEDEAKRKKRHRSKSRGGEKKRKEKKRKHDSKKKRSRSRDRADSNDGCSSSGSDCHDSEKLKLMWRVLLDKRPSLDDDKSMCNWLDQVVEVSKKKTKNYNFPEDDLEQPKSSSSVVAAGRRGREADPKPMNMLGLASSPSSTSSSDGEAKDEYKRDLKPMRMLGLSSRRH